MIKFNKVFNLRIISSILACAFLLTNIAYGIDLPERTHLRVPVGHYDRMNRVLNAITVNNGPTQVSSEPSNGEDNGTLGPKQEERAKEPKEILISGHGPIELDNHKLQELKGRIFDEIDRTTYTDDRLLNGRIEEYKDFVLSQAQRYGIHVENKTPNIVEYNREMVISLTEELQSLLSELIKGKLKRAARTLPTIIAHMAYMIFQVIPPMVLASYKADGELDNIKWSAKGRILYFTNLAVLVGAWLLGADYGFIFLVGNVFMWIVINFARVEGHELSHVYQRVILERARQELVGNKMSPEAFSKLIPNEALYRTIDTYPVPLHREPPDRERLKAIVEEIFEELNKYASLTTQEQGFDFGISTASVQTASNRQSVMPAAPAIEVLSEGTVKRFLTIIKEHRIEGVVVYGGAVRDLILGKTETGKGDIDILIQPQPLSDLERLQIEWLTFSHVIMGRDDDPGRDIIHDWTREELLHGKEVNGERISGIEGLRSIAENLEQYPVEYVNSKRKFLWDAATAPGFEPVDRNFKGSQEQIGHYLDYMRKYLKDRIIVGRVDDSLDKLEKALGFEEGAILRCEGRFEETGIDYLGYLDENGQIIPLPAFEQFLGKTQLSISTLSIDSEGRLIDYYGGYQDLREGVLRFVGKDPIRYANHMTILNAIRFKHQFGFRFTPETEDIVYSFFRQPERFPESGQWHRWLNDIESGEKQASQVTITLWEKKGFDSSVDPLAIATSLRDIYKNARNSREVKGDLEKIGILPIINASGIDLDGLEEEALMLRSGVPVDLDSLLRSSGNYSQRDLALLGSAAFFGNQRAISELEGVVSDQVTTDEQKQKAIEMLGKLADEQNLSAIKALENLITALVAIIESKTVFDDSLSQQIIWTLSRKSLTSSNIILGGVSRIVSHRISANIYPKRDSVVARLKGWISFAKRHSSSPQIGKRAQLVSVEGDIAKVRDSQGNIHTFTLGPTRPIDIPVLRLQIEGMTENNPAYKELVSAILSLLENSPPESHPQLRTFDTLIEDLFGFASTEPNLIALHQDFADNSVAIFHEITEYLVRTNVLTLRLEGETLVISAEGREFSLILEGETLAIAQKDPNNPHYLLRALQRKVFERKDMDLTKRIKINQQSIEELLRNLGSGEFKWFDISSRMRVLFRQLPPQEKARLFAKILKDDYNLQNLQGFYMLKILTGAERSVWEGVVNDLLFWFDNPEELPYITLLLMDTDTSEVARSYIWRAVEQIALKHPLEAIKALHTAGFESEKIVAMAMIHNAPNTNAQKIVLYFLTSAQPEAFELAQHYAKLVLAFAEQSLKQGQTFSTDLIENALNLLEPSLPSDKKVSSQRVLTEIKAKYIDQLFIINDIFQEALMLISENPDIPYEELYRQLITEGPVQEKFSYLTRRQRVLVKSALIKSRADRFKWKNEFEQARKDYPIDKLNKASSEITELYKIRQEFLNSLSSKDAARDPMTLHQIMVRISALKMKLAILRKDVVPFLEKRFGISAKDTPEIAIIILGNFGLELYTDSESLQRARNSTEKELAEDFFGKNLRFSKLEDMTHLRSILREFPLYVFGDFQDEMVAYLTGAELRSRDFDELLDIYMDKYFSRLLQYIEHQAWFKEFVNDNLILEGALEQLIDGVRSGPEWQKTRQVLKGVKKLLDELVDVKATLIYYEMKQQYPELGGEELIARAYNQASSYILGIFQLMPILKADDRLKDILARLREELEKKGISREDVLSLPIKERKPRKDGASTVWSGFQRGDVIVSEIEGGLRVTDHEGQHLIFGLYTGEEATRYTPDTRSFYRFMNKALSVFKYDMPFLQQKPAAEQALLTPVLNSFRERNVISSSI